MSKYITDLQVSLNETDEKQLRKEGFSKSDVDVNKGVRGKNIHLWYKKGNSGAITRITLSFNDAMSDGLNKAGYQKIPKNLNTGAGGNDIYLWFFRGNSEDHVPIVDLQVSTTDEAHEFKSGWERHACDLNQKDGGHQVFLWVRRERATYICDITATNSGEGCLYYWCKGYIPMWPSTNIGTDGPVTFIWYRQTTKPEEAIRELQVSINGDEFKNFIKQGYKLANINLNQGTRGNPVYLWFKKDACDCYPIKAVTLISAGPDPYPIQWWEIILKNLNAGNSCAPEVFLCFRD